MFFSILSFSFFGLLLGILTGITPGLHPNTISLLVFGYLVFDPMLTSVLIVSTAVSHTFFDFIPSIFLGAPNPDTALSVLPGHDMMMKGLGYEAIYLTAVGGVVSLSIVSVLLPIISIFIKMFYGLIRNNIHWILIFIVIYMLLRDRKFFGFVSLGLSGILGLIVLNNNMFGNNIIFPMLTGLFGTSAILYSMRAGKEIPTQRKELGSLNSKNILLGGLIGSISGIITGLLPGIGAAQATFLSQEVIGRRNNKMFMVAIGGVNTTVAIFSLFSLWLIGTPRSGVSIVIEKLITFGLNEIIIFSGIILLVSAISAILTIILSKKIIELFRKIKYRTVNLFTLLLIITLVFILSGMYGVLILMLSTAIGMISILSGTRRTYLMGCLLLPTILFFL
ncbi:MAG: tripartite tricarboxylate transporter permease [Candidatus Aenigmarchaeota archaeon]|nr:tripartite tricarboxylate transporter permease [Candidatus Aenigmarchaeota archaeon]